MNIKELIVESLTDNRKLIVGLYVLFIIAFIAAWILTAPKMEAIAGNVTAMNAPGVGTDAIDLLIHNEMSGIITYIASAFFGIAAVVMVAYNGFNLGMIGALFAKILPNGGIMYILYLIPHGIFEITGTILQSAAGILLFLFIWRYVRARMRGEADAFEKNKKALVQSVVLMVIAIVLTLVAAPIEAYFSAPFAEFMMRIFGLM